MKYRFIIIFSIAIVCCLRLSSQEKTPILGGVNVALEASATMSDGDFAPLWLSSNRQGIVSPYGNSSYERLSAIRPLSYDSLAVWKIGYGIDIQYSQNAQTNLFVHQAYAEVGWKNMTLCMGQKEREIDLRNNLLTSGGLSQGINARPLPEVLLYIDYFPVPGTHEWLKLRGRIGYGMTTDGNWQEEWVGDPTTMKYTGNVLYHEKAGYLKVGKEQSSFPLVFEGGLQMQCLFGGSSYNVVGRSHYGNNKVDHPQGVSAFWHAFLPFGSSDETDGVMQNAQGDQVGSWNMALSWHGRDWMVRTYFERFFEDHSQMFTQYGISDHLVGFEAKLPHNPYLGSIVVEHLSTLNQSGAVYHDATNSMDDQISARDRYYNHVLYSGWQNFGMSMGTPLLTSPIYNVNELLTSYTGKLKELYFFNNRVSAWHFGFSGTPSTSLSWRCLFTRTRNMGTYGCGWDPIYETHLLCELYYQPSWAKGYDVKVAGALSHGDIIGNTTGMQFTIRKNLKL